LHALGPLCGKNGLFFLLYDNAPVHAAAIITQFLARKIIPVLDHSPCSSDLSPPDYFLFPKLKMELKGDHFVTIETIQEAVTEKFKNISETNFSRVMEKLGDRARSCIECNDDCFEYKICLKNFFNRFVASVTVVSKLMGRTVYLMEIWLTLHQLSYYIYVYIRSCVVYDSRQNARAHARRPAEFSPPP